MDLMLIGAICSAVISTAWFGWIRAHPFSSAPPITRDLGAYGCGAVALVLLAVSPHFEFVFVGFISGIVLFFAIEAVVRCTIAKRKTFPQS